MANTADLVKYVIAELSERGFDVIKTALVKLLYLADVESVRQGSPRISNLDWIFYKYGPYAFEIDQILQRIAGHDIDELAAVSSKGRGYVRYRSGGHEETFQLNWQERGVFNSVLDRWGGEALEKLLNYVYFDTEPMLEAEWRKPLNFGLIRPREEMTRLADFLAGKVPAEEVQRLMDLKQNLWKRLSEGRQQLVEPTPSPRYDEVFAKGLRVSDKEGTAT